MRARTLEWLRCPAPGCWGPLGVGTGVKAEWTGGPGSELLEGVLACSECDSEYPVLMGVAILVPEQGHYLWAFWSEIQRSEQESGSAVSDRMRRYLQVPDAAAGLAAPSHPSAHGLDWTTSPYLQYHFDPGSLTLGIPDGWWNDSLSRKPLLDPYTYLADAAARLGGSHEDGLAVEVGASVGRTSADLARRYGFTVGIDWSFGAILAARRALLREPSPLSSYPLEGERRNSEPRPLPQTNPLNNADFVVADAAALPFGLASASCVAALNVICAVPDPGRLLGELGRVAASGGLLLFSSPFWLDEAETGPVAPASISNPGELRNALAGEFEIEEERDLVPWVLRLAKRRWNLYLCYCLAARRRGA